MSNPFPVGTKLPHHLAMIPDGNRRWAKEHGLPTLRGHLKGFEALLRMAKASRQWGIHTATVWIFSTENWKRSPKEISYLMKIEEEMLKKYLPELKKDRVRIIHLGRKDRIPKSFAKTLAQAEIETQNNQKHVLNIAVDYGGHDEILRAITKLMVSFPRHACRQAGKRESSILDSGLDPRVKPEDDKFLGFEQYLDTAGQPFPNPDLLIRTSGEERTSGFMPWQTAYAEFVFLKKHLPDCTVEDLKNAVLEYSKRQRRFGGN